MSRLHGDHFDRIAKKELDQGLPIFTTSLGADRLRGWGFGHAVGMVPWSERTLESGPARLRITSVPGEHAPAVARRRLPTVMSSVLELDQPGEEVVRLYITGDTLYRP